MVAKGPPDRGEALVKALWPFSGAPGAMVYGDGYEELCDEVDEYLGWLATLPPSAASRDVADDGERAG